jgi:hypothetical protein
MFGLNSTKEREENGVDVFKDSSDVPGPRELFVFYSMLLGKVLTIERDMYINIDR